MPARVKVENVLQRQSSAAIRRGLFLVSSHDILLMSLGVIVFCLIRSFERADKAQRRCACGSRSSTGATFTNKWRSGMGWPHAQVFSC